MKKIVNNTIYASCLFFGVVSASNASLVITSNQSVEVSGKYLPAQPANVPDPRLDFSTSYNGNNSGGLSQFDFELSDKGIGLGLAQWDISIEKARLKSDSDLLIQHQFGNKAGFTDLKVDVNSDISYSDTITVRDLTQGQDPVPNNLHVRFEVDLTGKLLNTVNYDDTSNGGASTANYFTEAKFLSTIANSGGNANQDWEVAKTASTHSNGFFNGSNVDETDELDLSVIFEDLLWNGQAILFDWTYRELFEVEILNIDAGSIDLHMQNDLSNTIITKASVFDANGNWLPDYVVQSSGGFDYAQMFAANPINPVNAPSVAGLLLCALSGVFLMKRSQRS